MDEFLLSETPLSAETLEACAARLEHIPLDDAVWVAEVLRECHRARLSEAKLIEKTINASGQLDDLQQDIAQIVLDSAEWLKTLWHVGYMGAGRFPAAPRSEFPAVEVDDIVKSALLARIRQGQRPLPFPPPTRQGMPWHEVVESNELILVEASLVLDEGVPIAAIVESCNDWLVCSSDVLPPQYVVQHQGKGPRYLLQIDPLFSSLQRLPPTWVRRIILQERAAVRSFSLEWPRGDGSMSLIPLRAASWERAESDASHWVATKHPEMYGQIRFEHVDPV